MTAERRKQIVDAFPFEYVGGGFFRAKGIPKGEEAPMLHGSEVLEQFLIYLSLWPNN
jgi:hypothetical protein